MANPKLSITKSRAGHYTATARLLGYVAKEDKLPSLHAARFHGARLVAEVAARAEQVPA